MAENIERQFSRDQLKGFAERVDNIRRMKVRQDLERISHEAPNRDIVPDIRAADKDATYLEGISRGILLTAVLEDSLVECPSGHTIELRGLIEYMRKGGTFPATGQPRPDITQSQLETLADLDYRRE